MVSTSMQAASPSGDSSIAGAESLEPFLLPALPSSSFAQTVAFDLAVTAVPTAAWTVLFAHGRADVVDQRRQVVLIDGEHRRIYAAIWHNGLQNQVILASPIGSLDRPCNLQVIFSVSTILGIYSLFINGIPVEEIIEQNGAVRGGSLVETSVCETGTAHGVSIANLRTYGAYLTPSDLFGLGVNDPVPLFRMFDESEAHFSCHDLEKRVHLGPWVREDNLNFCCFVHKRRGQEVGFMHIAGASIVDSKLPIDKIGEVRQQVKAIINRGEQETDCHGCPRLWKEKWQPNRENTLSRVVVASFTACNLRCEYCYTLDPKTHFLATPPYDLLTLFRDLWDQGKLEPNSHVDWGGGDVSVLPGFEEVSTFLTEIGATQQINTNAITFSKAIANGLARGLMYVTVSLDAGTRERYDAIKGRDRLEAVWANLEKYHKIAIESGHSFGVMPHPVMVKYIMYHNNCDMSELSEFIRRCRVHGMKWLTITDKQGELLPNGRNEKLAMHPAPGDDERVLRGAAFLRQEAMKSQIRSMLWGFSVAEQNQIQQYEGESLIGW